MFTIDPKLNVLNYSLAVILEPKVTEKNITPKLNLIVINTCNKATNYNKNNVS